jgi:hypothetical protein
MAAYEPPSNPDERFKHRPLDATKKQIRLIQIVRTDAVSCLVEHYTIEEEPNRFRKGVIPVWSNLDYVALSYKWEYNNVIPSTIIVNGLSMIVSFNLHNFLLEMQTQGATEKFWVDQLCIDQQDVQELNNQISMMGEIYSNARIVYVWLGLATDQTEKAIQLLATFKVAGRDIEAAYPIVGHDHSSGIRHSTIAGAEIRDLVDRLRGHADQLSLRDLFDRPYWSRLWIVQEVLLAPATILLCGRFRHQLPSSYIQRRICNLYIDTLAAVSITNHTVHDALMLLWHCESMCEPGTPFAWGQVVHLLSGRECSDPRDIIFGLQACVLPEYRIRVDYDVSSEELFVGVAKAMRPPTIDQSQMAGWIYKIRVLHRALKIDPSETISHDAIHSMLTDPSWLASCQNASGDLSGGRSIIDMFRRSLKPFP